MTSLCKIDGCGAAVRYKEQGVCQKHYFRFMRNGSYDKLPRTRAQRIEMPGKGYQRVYDPTHPLADSGGYVSEHRKVVYSRYGAVLPPCELCGTAIDWNTAHIDHIDEDVRNNDSSNLRPLCRPCNTFRSYPKQHTLPRRTAITFQGETKTPHEWSRDPRVKVASTTIRLRKAAGMSDEDALFAPKITHRAKPATKPATPKYGQGAK